jgi:hypothetical protein
MLIKGKIEGIELRAQNSASCCNDDSRLLRRGGFSRAKKEERKKNTGQHLRRVAK